MYSQLNHKIIGLFGIISLFAGCGVDDGATLANTEKGNIEMNLVYTSPRGYNYKISGGSVEGAGPEPFSLSLDGTGTVVSLPKPIKLGTYTVSLNGTTTITCEDCAAKKAKASFSAAALSESSFLLTTAGKGISVNYTANIEGLPPEPVQTGGVSVSLNVSEECTTSNECMIAKYVNNICVVESDPGKEGKPCTSISGGPGTCSDGFCMCDNIQDCMN